MFGAPVKKSVVAHIHASSRMFGAPVKSIVAHIHACIYSSMFSAPVNKLVVAHIHVHASCCMTGAPVKKLIRLCDNTCKCQHSSFKSLPFA